MADEVLVINSINDLRQFLNEKGILEIATRRQDKKFKAFVKVALNDFPQPEAKQAASQMIMLLNKKNSRIAVKNLEMVRHVVKLQNMELILNGLNLCATCAGFAIMYAKLDAMSAEITQQIDALHQTVRKGTDVQTGYEFKKVLSEHTNMLDARKIQQPYSEEKMRELVDAEYNVLDMLISVLNKDIAADIETTITSIFSLLSMLTVSLKYFDEQYYFNHHDVVDSDEVWHSSHDKWMSVYDAVQADWFVEKIQDHASFDTKLSIPETDVYYTEYVNQAVSLKQEVEDNQKLILALQNQEQLYQVNVMLNKEVQESIEDAVKEAFAGIDMPGVQDAVNSAVRQVSLLS